MTNFTILTDSSADLPASLVEKYNIRVIPLSVFVEGKQYYNYPDGHDISFEDFYSAVSDGKLVTTSAVNASQFQTVMESELMMGNDILYIGFSSALSGTYSAGAYAAHELADKYPNRKILTVDSLCASLGQGLLLYLACREKEKGKSIEEVCEYTEKHKMRICHWFTVNDLYQLKRGGRISGATAVAGTLLNIKPVLHVDNEGRLVNVTKARGRNASIKALFDKAVENARKPEKQTFFISHGDCYDDAKKLADMLTERFGSECIINFVGPVIGAHSGKGTLALFFVGNER